MCGGIIIIIGGITTQFYRPLYYRGKPKEEDFYQINMK